MRYTEARLARITDLMLTDLEKDTVGWHPNFDNTLREPDVLPAALPNLLINGSSGIAVGMATNIPPHNLGEVVDALVYMIDRFDTADETTTEAVDAVYQGAGLPHRRHHLPLPRRGQRRRRRRCHCPGLFAWASRA